MNAKSLLIIFYLFFFSADLSFSQTNQINSKYSFSMNVGAGYFIDKIQDEPIPNTRLFMSFFFGYRISRILSVGIDFNGWLFEPTNYWNPSEGKGLSQLFISTRLDLDSQRKYYIIIETGVSNFWNNNLIVFSEKEGVGNSIGIGIRLLHYNNFYIIPQFSVSFGKFPFDEFSVLTCSVGIEWN